MLRYGLAWLVCNVLLILVRLGVIHYKSLTAEYTSSVLLTTKSSFLWAYSFVSVGFLAIQELHGCHFIVALLDTVLSSLYRVELFSSYLSALASPAVPVFGASAIRSTGWIFTTSLQTSTF